LRKSNWQAGKLNNPCRIQVPRNELSQIIGGSLR
jgi:hypothetical protein